MVKIFKQDMIMVLGLKPTYKPYIFTLLDLLNVLNRKLIFHLLKDNDNFIFLGYFSLPYLKVCK